MNWTKIQKIRRTSIYNIRGLEHHLSLKIGNNYKAFHFEKENEQHIS